MDGRSSLPMRAAMMYNLVNVAAGVVLSAASKCDTPNVKGMAPSHRAAVRPSTGEPKRQPSGQRGGRANPPGRLQRTASAEAGPAAAAASAVSRQSSAPPAAIEAASTQVHLFLANAPQQSTGKGYNTDFCATSLLSKCTTTKHQHRVQYILWCNISTEQCTTTKHQHRLHYRLVCNSCLCLGPCKTVNMKHGHLQPFPLAVHICVKFQWLHSVQWHQTHYQWYREPCQAAQPHQIMTTLTGQPGCGKHVMRQMQM